jgi:isoaspartyl peptidase/L-asparaginase-like protein (Ntn-hydrolase superfamily)
MQKRREFLGKSALALAATVTGVSVSNCSASYSVNGKEVKGSLPLVISTWDFGIQANEAAWEILKKGGASLDAVEKGVMVAEADASNSSVGLGGLPDRDGRVTLDACIMDYLGNAGSVSCIEHILHPISVARLVMEKTPHVMLVGEGALQFALDHGFKKENLLTEASRKAWEQWKITSKYEPKINVEIHDTIGMLAIDSGGNIAGACTTSGLAYKMHGRVGDSPIIGAGLFVDNEVGGAVATGLGEAVLKSLSSFLAVELMRNGKSPTDACRIAVERILRKIPKANEIQVALIAVNKNGEFGGYSIHKGFNYALYQDNTNKLYIAKHLI